MIINSTKPIIKDSTQYWAMHFCSILETLYYHNTLQYSFNNKEFNSNEKKTLCNLRGFFGINFFESLRGYLYNWGLQYLLCYYLISDVGKNILIDLVDKILAFNGYDHITYNKSTIEIFVSGADSNKSIDELKKEKAFVLGYKEESYDTISDLYHKIKDTDLCILIEPDFMEYKLAIFGEVEGNKSYKLLQDNFWSKKSPCCRFGIGVNCTKNEAVGNITTEYYETLYGDEKIVVLYIDSKFDVINDFHSAINIMQLLFINGPLFELPIDDSLKNIISLIKENWFSPVKDLIDLLSSMTIKSISPIIRQDQLIINSTPSIILN